MMTKGRIKLDSSRATHNLLCVHSYGRSRVEYHMPCLILKEMPAGRVKLLVFGDRRNLLSREKVQRIRYVDKSRLSLRS